MRARRLLAGNNLGGGTGRAARRGRPPPLQGKQVLPGLPALAIVGVTRDSAGAPLGSCEVELYRRAQDQTQGVYVARVVSDGSGNFTFSPVGLGQLYQHIAYKPGAPDVAGVSVRTVAGA